MPTDPTDDLTSGSERGYDHNAQARGYADAGVQYDVSTQVSISVEHSAASVPIAGPYVGRGPRGYTRSEERTREDVCERLTEDGQIDASNIEVTIENGEITLSGTVASLRAKRLAEDIAYSVKWVKEVHNRLRVAGPHSEEVDTRLR